MRGLRHSGTLKRTAQVAALALLIATLCTIELAAQDSQKDSLTDYLNSVAKLTYSMAWPSATYKSWNFAAPVKDVDGGWDVVIQLNGLSYFDGSDLWLKIGLAIRSDGIKNFWVVDHNAIIMPPFKTMQGLAEITAELAKQYQQSQVHRASQATPTRSPVPPPQPQSPPNPPPSRAAAVCLSNDTTTDLKIRWHWGASDWSNGSIASQTAMIYSFPMDAGATIAPRFYVEYNDDLSGAYEPQDSELERYAVPLPAMCDAAKQYLFVAKGSKLVLQATN